MSQLLLIAAMASLATPPIAVFAVPRDASGQRAAVQVAPMLRQVVASDRRWQLLEPAKTAPPTQLTQQTLDQARSALAKGNAAYDGFDLDAADRELTRARSLFISVLSELEDRSLLWRCTELLAATSVLLGDRPRAEKLFRSLLTQNSNFSPQDPPSAVAKVYEDVATAQVQSRGTIDVYSTPTPAAIYLDERFVGVSPKKLTDIPVGEHVVRLEREGFEPTSSLIDVQRSGKTMHQAKLTPLADGDALLAKLARLPTELAVQKKAATGASAIAHELADLLKAERVLLALTHQSGAATAITLALYDGNGTLVATQARTISAEDSDFEQQIRNWASDFLQAPERARRPPSEAKAPASTATHAVAPPPTPSRLVPWALLGAGGVAAVVGGVFAVLAHDTHQAYRDTAQQSADLQTLRSRGKRQALIADVSFATAGALAVAGAVMLWLTPTSHAATSFAIAPSVEHAGLAVSFTIP